MPPALISLGQTQKLTGMSRADCLRRFSFRKEGLHYYTRRDAVDRFLAGFGVDAPDQRRTELTERRQRSAVLRATYEAAEAQG
jgi:hypothetical protein